MNLLIGLVILLCLLCSEINTTEEVSDLWTRVIWVAIVSLTVPGLALFQTLVVSRRMRSTELEYQQRDAILKRLSVCHSAVWFTASLAIIWAVRWQDVVRGNWNLDQWLLLDEVFILAPVVLSLVASWAIFFDIQLSVQGESKSRFKFEQLKQRLGFVSIRFRVYFLMILIPISIAVLARDLAPWFDSLSMTECFFVYGVSGIFVMGGFPLLLLLIWKNERVHDESLRDELIATCRHFGIKAARVRVWNTGNQVINAVVAGVLPYLRVILLSDRLVKPDSPPA